MTDYRLAGYGLRVDMGGLLPSEPMSMRDTLMLQDRLHRENSGKGLITHIETFGRVLNGVPPCWHRISNTTRG